MINLVFGVVTCNPKLVVLFDSCQVSISKASARQSIDMGVLSVFWTILTNKFKQFRLHAKKTPALHGKPFSGFGQYLPTGSD